MGQTLTHGIYLPDEGERNCYDGLASNWQLLDGAVGTVAEHTSQIAGKAPAVHTHTKSDVTDLFNSANVWSANQTISNNSAALILKNPQMTLGVTPSSALVSNISFQDVNNTSIGYIQLRNHNNSNNMLSLVVKNKNGADSYECALRFRITKYGTAMLYPENASCDLGSASLPFKTINSINPGALSFPNLTSNGYINLSDNISANTEYSYTPPADGWLALYVQTTGFHAENAVAIFNGSGSGSAYRWACSATSGINLAKSNYYHGAVILPVIAGIPYLCWIKIDSSTTLASKVLYFYKAAGNV